MILNYSIYLMSFVAIFFGLSGYFKKEGTFLAPAFGVCFFAISAFLSLEFPVLIALIVICIYHCYKGSNSLLSDLNRYHFLAFIFLLAISYFQVIQFWQYGPPGENQDTIWNIGHIAYYKNNLPFVSSFSDLHIWGNDINYHFFGHYLSGRLANIFHFSAVSAGVMLNSIFLLAAFFLLSKYLLDEFKITRIWTVGLSMAPMIIFGLFSPFNPYFDAIVNTTGIYYYRTNLFVTLSLFFSTAGFLIYLKMMDLGIDSLRKKNLIYIICFNIYVFLATITKGPYGAMLIAACGLHSFLNILLSKQKMKQNKLIPGFVASLVALFIFVGLYLTYYRGITGDVLSVAFAESIQSAFKRWFPSSSLQGWSLILSTPFYLLAFFGLGLLTNCFHFMRFSKVAYLRHLSSFGLASFTVGALFFLFLKQRGGSEIYFATAALSLVQLSAVLGISFRLKENLIFDAEKAFWKTIFCISILSFFLLPFALILVFSCVLLLIAKGLKIIDFHLFLKTLMLSVFVLCLYFNYRQFQSDQVQFLGLVVIICAGCLFFLNQNSMFQHLLFLTAAVGFSLGFLIRNQTSWQDWFGYVNFDFQFAGLWLCCAGLSWMFAKRFPQFFVRGILVLYLVFLLKPYVSKEFLTSQEIALRKACLWIKDQSTFGDKVAINFHDDEKAGAGRFFSCSATSERQILIEGYDYLPQTASARRLVSDLLSLNQDIFKTKSFSTVRFIVDVKNEISVLRPALELPFDHGSIKVYKRPDDIESGIESGGK